jgi:uncharacterized repeat protein (TIGR03833 family)
MPNNIKRSQLVVGMEVKINPRTDKTRRLKVVGLISEILSSGEAHPHGILVKLNDGEVGRVKAIVSGESTMMFDSAPNTNSAAAVSDLIASGEDHFVEFKSSCLWSQGLSKEEISKRNLGQYGAWTSKVVIAKSIAGFLNGDGGSLLIGIREVKESDDVEVIGVGSEFSKLQDKTVDGYRRMLLDSIVKRYFPSFVFNRINDYIKISFEVIEGSQVCRLDVSKSDKRVFLGLNSEDVFIVRIDASSRQITGEDVVQYCLDRFVG